MQLDRDLADRRLEGDLLVEPAFNRLALARRQRCKGARCFVSHNARPSLRDVFLDGCRDGVQERLIQYRLASKSTAPAVIAYTVMAMSL